ncbi:MAG: S49 family peptidase [Methylococcaceae bacterium]|nr:S49 family peptidase [Methylococcaceae bacterium]
MTDQQSDARQAGKPADWESKLLEKVLMAGIAEQRRARRWGIAFKLALLVYAGITLWLVAAPFDVKTAGGSGPHTAVVDVVGTIIDGGDTNAASVMEGLRDAAKDKGTKGIILRMNSPGGSPVQSAYVWEDIRRLKQERPDLPVYAVVSDLCASGCYYVASAADKIFVNGSSVVGSIGVIMPGFGFVDALGKLGVERRVLTAGEHKALLDPFSPVSEAEKLHIQQNVLNAIHQQFISAVRQGRGERLRETPELFSGLVWTGDEGIKLGLADGLGDVPGVAKTVIGAEKVVNFTPRQRWIERLSQRVGTRLAQGVLSAVGAGLELR